MNRGNYPGGQSGTDSPPLEPKEPVAVNNPPVRAEVPVKADPPPRPKEKGEMTLVLIPEATVSKGSQLLGHGTMVSFSLNVGTHLVTVTGGDGVKRQLSLQVGAGKNKAQKYRLDDLPPQ